MTQEEFELKLQQISEQLEHIIKLYINIEAAFDLAYALELERQDLLKFCSHPKHNIGTIHQEIIEVDYNVRYAMRGCIGRLTS